MLSLLQGWQGSAKINGTEYASIQAYAGEFEELKPFSIVLYPKQEKSQNKANLSDTEPSTQNQEVVITVKKYMTKKAEPGFDFMAKWNNNVPMPLRTMVGHKIKETPGMVKMELHGDILQEKTFTCMCCGRKLTNPVSQYFGIGPECGNHNYVNPFNSEEELRQAVDAYKEKLRETKWTGWIIKSAITKMEEV